MDTSSDGEIAGLLRLFQSAAHPAAGQLAQDLIARGVGGAIPWKVYAACLRQQGQSDMDALLRASQVHPGDAEIWCNLGHTLRERGMVEQAIHCFRRAVQIEPEFAIALCNLGIALLDTGQQVEGVALLQKALCLRPGLIHGHNSVGIALSGLGRHEEALAHFRQAQSIDPSSLAAYTNALFVSNLVPDAERAQLLRDAQQVGRMLAHGVMPFDTWTNARDPDKCLRIGLLSGDLRDHAVAHFLTGVLEAARAADLPLQWFAYDTHPKRDAAAERLRRTFHAWQDVSSLSDSALAEAIRRDGIDILLDMSGHTAHNRLQALAHKPAPVQAAWIGYLSTTGVAAIDYIIADPHTVDVEEERYYTETVWRMPEIFCCFTAPDAPLDVSPLPALANGYITFGSFNNLSKINEGVIALWSRVLRVVPASRILIKCGQNKHEAVRQHLLARFAEHGVTAERLILEGSSPRNAMLAVYRQIDIALDTFPYTGCTTTIEALWMGVPVLTLAGEHYLGRQSESILANVGLHDWITHSAEDYLAAAKHHAADLGCLSDLRAGLRERALQSPLFDAPRFARHFEAALRAMWRKWCAA